MKQVSESMPWLMPEVIAWLGATLREDWTVLETGAGGSTVFFAHRVQQVITYEHSDVWADKILGLKLPNVLVCNWAAYPVAGLNPESLPPIDFAFIDGRGRVRSVIDVLPKIKPSGWLMLDDSDRQRYQEAHRVAGELCSMKIQWRDCEGNETTAWRKN